MLDLLKEKSSTWKKKAYTRRCNKYVQRYYKVQMAVEYTDNISAEG